MRGRVILAAVIATLAFSHSLLAGGGGKGGASCGHDHCRCHQRHHPDHNWFHSAAPPRATVSSSIAAPQMFASPVLPVRSLRALNATNDKDLESDILQALESLLGEKIQKTPPTCSGSAASSPSTLPSSSSKFDQIEARLDSLQKRVSANQAKLDRLLTSLERFLESSDK